MYWIYINKYNKGHGAVINSSLLNLWRGYNLTRWVIFIPAVDQFNSAVYTIGLKIVVDVLSNGWDAGPRNVG